MQNNGPKDIKHHVIGKGHVCIKSTWIPERTKFDVNNHGVGSHLLNGDISAVFPGEYVESPDASTCIVRKISRLVDTTISCP